MLDTVARRVAAAVITLTALSVFSPTSSVDVWALDSAPKIVISISSGSGTTICDSDCTTCTVGSGECIDTVEEELLLCRPLATTLPITGCDWELLFDGDSAGLQLNSQLRAAEIAPNGNIVFVALNDENLPDIGSISKNDVALFVPDDVNPPYMGGGPYTMGTFNFYLNGDLTQQDEATKPWDALEILLEDDCASDIQIQPGAEYSCPIVGSLTSGSGSTGLGGIRFRNEDLLRCVPAGFGVDGTVEACTYSFFLDASNINADTYGENQGITTDIEAIDFVSFDPATMSGEMAFRKGSGTPPGFPAHQQNRDILLYEGTFGAGLCDVSGDLCAGDGDCPMSETCDTGSCSLDSAPCATDQDCSGGGNTCNITRYPAGTVSLLFDGSEVGLAGSAQEIEAFTIVPDLDNDDILDGNDTCTNPGGQQNLVVKPRLIAKRINTDVTVGNDRLIIKGEFGLPGSTDFSMLDPQARPVRIVVAASDGTIRVDETLGTGTFAGKDTAGWKVNGKGTKWTFNDKTETPVNGFVKVAIIDRSKKVLDRVKVVVKGKDGDYPIVEGDQPLRGVVVVGDPADECTETDFVLEECNFNGKANNLVCKR